MDPKNVEGALRVLEIELDGLPETAEPWPEWPEHWRDGLMMEWGTRMGELRMLHREFRSGKMSDDHAQRYRRITLQLRDYLPILRQLGWVLPDIPHEEAA